MFKSKSKSASRAWRCEQAVAFIYWDKARKGCHVCGENRPSCLDCHHLRPEEKEYNIGWMAYNGISPSKILAEVVKCVVLCSNCHRVEERGTGFDKVPFEVPATFRPLPICRLSNEKLLEKIMLSGSAT